MVQSMMLDQLSYQVYDIWQCCCTVLVYSAVVTTRRALLLLHCVRRSESKHYTAQLEAQASEYHPENAARYTAHYYVYAS